MAWQLVYEDLQVYSSETHIPQDCPVDGLQFLIHDGRFMNGHEYYGFYRGQLIYGNILADLKKAHPEAHVVRTKSTSTRRFHEIEKSVGAWSDKNNPIPHSGWVKDNIGFRAWTETEVFESKGAPEDQWIDLWESWPDTGWQGLIVYENWKTPTGEDFQQYFAGGDHYALAPSAYGVVFLNSNDPIAEIERRYPGAIVKTGTLMPDEAYKPLEEIIRNTVSL